MLDATITQGLYRRFPLITTDGNPQTATGLRVDEQFVLDTTPGRWHRTDPRSRSPRLAAVLHQLGRRCGLVLACWQTQAEIGAAVALYLILGTKLSRLDLMAEHETSLVCPVQPEIGKRWREWENCAVTCSATFSESGWSCLLPHRQGPFLRFASRLSGQYRSAMQSRLIALLLLLLLAVPLNAHNGAVAIAGLTP